jgi:hypothetical protein
MKVYEIMIAVLLLFVGVLATSIVALIRDDPHIWIIGRYDQWGLPEKIIPKKNYSISEDLDEN